MKRFNSPVSTTLTFEDQGSEIKDMMFSICTVLNDLKINICTSVSVIGSSDSSAVSLSFDSKNLTLLTSSKESSGIYPEKYNPKI